MSAGDPGNVVRTVTENSRTLNSISRGRGSPQKMVRLPELEGVFRAVLTCLKQPDSAFYDRDSTLFDKGDRSPGGVPPQSPHAAARPG
jgi:hypothetical protein